VLYGVDRHDLIARLEFTETAGEFRRGLDRCSATTTRVAIADGDATRRDTR
jgi:hypothetical protein